MKVLLLKQLGNKGSCIICLAQLTSVFRFSLKFVGLTESEIIEEERRNWDSSAEYVIHEIGPVSFRLRQEGVIK